MPASVGAGIVVGRGTEFDAVGESTEDGVELPALLVVKVS